MVRVVRYVYDNPGYQNSFDSAFQLDADYGSGQLRSAPLDTTQGSAIVELSSTSSQPVVATVKIYNETGTLMLTQNIGLNPYATHHIITDSILNGQRGMATVESNTPSSLLAVAMHYKRDQNLSINSMYGIPFAESVGAVLTSSYNTYLSQNSVAVLTNTQSSAQDVELVMVRSDGSTQIEGWTLTVPAKGALFVDLNYFEGPNNYGQVMLMPENPHTVSARVLRVRGSDYVIPVAANP